MDEQQQQQQRGLLVLDTSLVPPSTPPPPSYSCSLPFTFFDIFWLHSPPVERLFLYRLAPDADVAAIVSSLKRSLSRAVAAFYPLAGRIRLAPGPGRYELHYRPGDAVTFTVAEADDHLDLDSLATDQPRQVAQIARLVPPLPEGGAVLALQATLLSARRGLAIGVTVHHAACDGSASTHFLHTWAAECTQAQPPPPPVIDRTLLPDPRGLYDVFLGDAPTTDEMEYVKMSPDQLLATFALSKDDLQRVKDAVAAEAATRGVAPPRCSSLVATLGLVWTCYQRAAAAAADDSSSSTTTSRSFLLFPVDHRSRMTPPLPAKYLGNCVGPALAVQARPATASSGTGSAVFTACAAVASAIDEAVRDIGTPRMDAWMHRIREATTTGTVLSVAGSPRFRVYDVDFGLGRPAKVDMVSVARTGAVSVAESRTMSGAGGMEVGVSLPPPAMARFRDCFADAMEELKLTTQCTTVECN